MGTFRLILAVFVVLSHVTPTFHGYNLGVTAVISFFLLSGYVMTLLVRKHYPAIRLANRFYVDRAARLYPQYLLYFCLTVGIVYAAHIGAAHTQSCSLKATVLNAAILPLGYFQFKPLGLSNCMYVPQAWSLGLELTFYAIAPFMILNRTVCRIGTSLSAIVFGLALSGVLNSNAFGYRLLPGTLFIFSVGIALADETVLGKLYPIAVWAVATVLVLITNTARETLLGLAIGVPLVYLLRDKKFSKFDELLGNISYGVFLNHIFCLLVLKASGFVVYSPTSIATLLAFSFALSAISYEIVEKPALNWRRQIRLQSDRQI